MYLYLVLSLHSSLEILTFQKEADTDWLKSISKVDEQEFEPGISAYNSVNF